MNPPQNPKAHIQKITKQVYKSSNSRKDTDMSEPAKKKRKTVSLQKIKNMGKTTTLTLTEKFDREGLCKIIALIRNGSVNISGDAQSSPEERTQRVLIKLEILRNTERDYLTTSYHRALFADGTPFGREHATGFSSQGMPRAIRAAMFGRIKKDIDEVDAHPALLSSLYDMPVLEDYHTNRPHYLQKVMQAHNVSRDDAKTLFLSVLNRKTPKTFYSCWLREQKEGDVVVRAALTADPEIEAFAKRLSDEVAVGRKKILSEPRHKKYSEIRDPDDHEGCFFNRLLCTWEYESLNVAIKMLEKRGYTVDNRIHDGCHIVNDKTTDLPSALNEINEELQKKWRLVEVKSKDFNMPDGFDDIEPEWRHKFNSSQAGVIDVISIKDIFNLASQAAKKTYATKAAMYRALKGLCLEMNRRGDVQTPDCGLVKEQMAHTRSTEFVGPGEGKVIAKMKYHTRWRLIDSIFEETDSQEAPDKFQWSRNGRFILKQDTQHGRRRDTVLVLISWLT